MCILGGWWWFTVRGERADVRRTVVVVGHFSKSPPQRRTRQMKIEMEMIHIRSFMVLKRIKAGLWRIKEMDMVIVDGLVILLR